MDLGLSSVIDSSVLVLNSDTFNLLWEFDLDKSKFFFNDLTLYEKYGFLCELGLFNGDVDC